jgi:hypothetical protein
VNHDSGFRAWQDPVLVVKVRTLLEGAREQGVEVKWSELSEEIQRRSGEKSILEKFLACALQHTS